MATPFGACCSGQEGQNWLSCFRLGVTMLVVDVFSAGFPVRGRRWGCRSFLRRGVRHEAVRRVTIVGINQRGDLAGSGGHDLHDPRRP